MKIPGEVYIPLNFHDEYGVEESLLFTIKHLKYLTWRSSPVSFHYDGDDENIFSSDSCLHVSMGMDGRGYKSICERCGI